MRSGVVRPHPVAEHEEHVRLGMYAFEEVRHACVNRAVDVPDGGAQPKWSARVVPGVPGIHQMPELVPSTVGFREDTEEEVPILHLEAMSQEGRLLLHTRK